MLLSICMNQHISELVWDGAVRSRRLSLLCSRLLRIFNRQIEQTGLHSHIFDGLLILCFGKGLQWKELWRVKLSGFTKTMDRTLVIRILGDFYFVQSNLAVCHSVGMVRLAWAKRVWPRGLNALFPEPHHEPLLWCALSSWLSFWTFTCRSLIFRHYSSC